MGCVWPFIAGGLADHRGRIWHAILLENGVLILKIGKFRIDGHFKND